MFTKEEILTGMAWWSVFGFFYIAICQPNVRDKKKAFWNAIVSGPICWVILAIAGLKFYVEGLLDGKSNT